MYSKCITCENWGKDKPHYHKEEDVGGLLNTEDIKRDTVLEEIEETDLEDGIIAYRYVWNPADLFKINSNLLLASISKCMCLDCINYSLSFIPHYGDGAYCTMNEQLKNEDARVMHAHGIDIRGMNYRVKIRIRDVSSYKKIKKTAGVIRSIPLDKKFYENDLIFTDENTIKIISFQKWNGVNWEEVLLEDIKEVS